MTARKELQIRPHEKPARTVKREPILSQENNFKIERLTSKSQDFENKFRACRDLLLRNFEVEVVTPEETLREYLKQERYVFVLATDQRTGKTVGAYAGSIHETDSGAMFYLHYTVVDRGSRKKGISTATTEMAIKQAKEISKKLECGELRYITAEVEAPKDNKDGAKIAALHAMERGGLCLVDGFQYYQPPFEEGDSPIPMALIIKDLNGERKEITRKEVFDLAGSLYRAYTDLAAVPEETTNNLVIDAAKQLTGQSEGEAKELIDSGEINARLSQMPNLKLTRPTKLGTKSSA
ncbi:MAG: GNAT family N-acetyltransferase [Candidatus Micrarchaeota archaeon]